MADVPPTRILGYLADFPVLGNDSDLYCLELIDVGWTKPIDDAAELQLMCDCGAVHNVPPVPLPAGTDQGTYRFTLAHPPHTKKTGVKITTQIRYGGESKSGNDRVRIKVQCPPDPSENGTKSEQYLAPDPVVVTLDSDPSPIHLVRNSNKHIWGRFNLDFGDEVIVTIQRKYADSEATHYVTAANTPFFVWAGPLLGWKIWKWRATLPYQLWGRAVTEPLLIQLFLTRKRDGRRAVARFATRVTG